MEPLLFIAFVYLFALLAFGRIAARRWRNARRENAMWDWAWRLRGRPVEDAIAAFGPPFDICPGAAHTLYEWKSPPATALPAGPGLLVVYGEVDADGVLTHITWATRGKDL